MSDARNCKRCGAIFQYIGGQPICPECKVEDEKIFKKVKEYLYDNPRASMSQVSNDLEVSVSRIKSYLKDGRLEIVGEGNMILECESCGRSITSGRFCNNCSNDMAQNLKKAASSMSVTQNQTQEAQKEAAKKSGGMRYLNKSERK